MARRAGEESLYRKQCQADEEHRGEGRRVSLKAGERSRRVNASAKLVGSIGGRDAPAPRAERTAAKSAQPHGSRAICTPSFNERSECPEEGWPVGPGRSLFTVSIANQSPCRAWEESLHRKQYQPTSAPHGRGGVSSQCSPSQSW